MFFNCISIVVVVVVVVVVIVVIIVVVIVIVIFKTMGRSKTSTVLDTTRTNVMWTTVF